MCPGRRVESMLESSLSNAMKRSNVSTHTFPLRTYKRTNQLSVQLETQNVSKTELLAFLLDFSISIVATSQLPTWRATLDCSVSSFGSVELVVLLTLAPNCTPVHPLLSLCCYNHRTSCHCLSPNVLHRPPVVIPASGLASHISFSAQWLQFLSCPHLL